MPAASPQPLTPEPPGAIVVPPAGGDRAPAINEALRAAAAAGGGTVYLPPGRYELGEPLVIETAIGADDRQEVPFHVRLRGAAPVGSYAEAKTTLIYAGADPSAAVVDVTHSRNVTIENLRIEAGPGRRFRCGILFHRTDSALTGRGRLLAPSALNVFSCGIAAGAGAFTVGVRLGDAGERGDLDQNCDHNRLEGLWIEGATDEPGGPQAALREGRTAAGVLVAGSQVQGSFFADLHIRRCTTGIFVLDGQLALFGGELAENGGPVGSGPAGRGGGDVVFRTGLRAGHLLQDVVSRGSTHFLTSFLEDAESVPPTGQSAAWQGDALIAAAAISCTITGCTDPGRALDLLGNGGPLVLAGCTLGAAGEPAHQVQVGGFTQGTVVLVDCSVNSLAPVVVRDDGATEGTRPRAQLLRVKGPGGELLPGDGAALPPLAFPLAPAARRRSSRPAAPGPQEMLGTGEFIPFVPDGERHFLEDSTELVQQALDALVKTGGTLYLPPALYTIKKTLVLRGARGARIAGIGGRGGASVLGPGMVRGTVLAWDGPTLGPVLRIEDCEDLVLEGLHFTTAGAPGTQGEITTVDTMIQVSSGQRLWLEDLGAGWLAGDGGAQGQGVCSTFLRLGASAQQVTLRAAQLQQVAREGVLVDGARGVELSLYVVADSRCALRLSGGEAAWLGGGAGNGASRMGGGATIALEEGRLYVGGIEVQDSAPSQVLQGAGRVVMAGADLLVPAPADGVLLDLLAGDLVLLGCGIGEAQAGPVPTVRTGAGAAVLSLGSALETRGVAAGFSGAGTVVDRGSRAFDRDQAGRWPQQVQLVGAR